MQKYDIVLICPSNHGYEDEIYLLLTRGARKVKKIIYAERDFYPPLYAILVLKLVKIVNWLCNVLGILNFDYYDIKDAVFYWYSKYFNEFIMEETSGLHCKNLFVVKGYMMSETAIMHIRADNRVLYQWDSLCFYPRIKRTYSCYDCIYTFDKSDSLAGHGKYLPNFCQKDNTLNQPVKDIDILVVMTYSRNRINVLKLLSKKIRECNMKSFIYVYMPQNILLSLYSKYYKIDFQQLPLAPEIYKSLLRRSRFSVEILNEGQVGSTQRYGDSLSNRCILLTNSMAAKNRKNVISINNFCAMNCLEIKKAAYEDVDPGNDGVVSGSEWIASINEALV